MKGLLTFELEVESVQKLTALRTKLATVLNEDEDVQMLREQSSEVGRSYSVSGVDTETQEPFREVVEAKDATDASDQVITGTRVAVEVREVEVAEESVREGTQTSD